MPGLQIAQLIDLAGDLIAGRWTTAQHMQFLEGSSFRIEGKDAMHVSIDGEAELLTGGLACEIRPAALKVPQPQTA